MSEKRSKIEWTDATWNPVTGCTRVSAGCDNCYAVPMSRRLEGAAKGAVGKAALRHKGNRYVGLTVKNRRGDWHFNGTVRCHEDELATPLRWTKPRMIFVNSMSDLFHEDVPFEFIDQVLATIAATPEHTYQILSKRAFRARQYFDRADLASSIYRIIGRWLDHKEGDPLGSGARWDAVHNTASWRAQDGAWFMPLPNLWLGTSVEDGLVDHRITELVQTKAAVRFLSCEPLIRELDLWPHMVGDGHDAPAFRYGDIDWIIIGGESGPKARPCSIDWIRNLAEQARSAGVPVFIKQLGRRVSMTETEWLELTTNADGESTGTGGSFTPDPDWPNSGVAEFVDKKGGDPSEWPEDLRIREWPEAAARQEGA